MLQILGISDDLLLQCARSATDDILTLIGNLSAGINDDGHKDMVEIHVKTTPDCSHQFMATLKEFSPDEVTIKNHHSLLEMRISSADYPTFHTNLLGKVNALEEKLGGQILTIRHTEGNTLILRIPHQHLDLLHKILQYISSEPVS